MAVDFKYSIASSQLGQKYHHSYNSLNYTIRQAVQLDCPTLVDVIDVVLGKLDNSVQKTVDNIANISDIIDKVASCILGKDDDYTKNVQEKILERAKRSLNGADFSPAVSRIDQMLDTINNSTTIPCVLFQQLLSEIGHIYDAIFNKQLEISASLNDLQQLIDDITSTIQKVAAFINCINSAFLKDEDNKLQDLIKYTRPDIEPIFLAAKQKLLTGGTPNEAILEAHAKINEMNNKSQRLQTIATTLEV